MHLKDYFRIFKRRLWIVLLVTIITAAGTAVYNYCFMKNIYESSTTIYVGKSTGDTTEINYNDVLMGQYLVKDYREIATSRGVSYQIVSELKQQGKLAKDFDPWSLTKKITVILKGETRIIEIKVQDVIPERSRDLANKAAQVLKIKIKELMKIDNVEIIDNAILPAKDNPAKPDRKRNIIISVFFGIIAGSGLILLIEYLDNTIKTSEDVKRFLELPVIGTIPNIDSSNGG